MSRFYFAKVCIFKIHAMSQFLLSIVRREQNFKPTENFDLHFIGSYFPKFWWLTQAHRDCGASGARGRPAFTPGSPGRGLRHRGRGERPVACDSPQCRDRKHQIMAAVKFPARGEGKIVRLHWTYSKRALCFLHSRMIVANSAFKAQLR